MSARSRPARIKMQRKLVHTEIIPMRWGDMDAMGHVNNILYFRYMEETRMAWFFKFGGASRADGQGPVIINASCTFLKQLVYPGDLEVKLYAGKPGRSSFETWVEMRPSYDSETLYAEGQAKVVWVDYAKAKSVVLPERIRRMVAE
jgi:acyl-CoA thioester hydrolase